VGERVDGSIGEGMGVGLPVEGSAVSPWMGDRVFEPSAPGRLGSAVLVPCRLGASVVPLVVPPNDGPAVVPSVGDSVLPPVLVGEAVSVLCSMLGVNVIVVPEGGAVMLPSFVVGLGVIVGSILVVVGASVCPSISVGSRVRPGASDSSVWVGVGVGSSVPLGGTVNGTAAAAVLGAIVGSTSVRVEGMSLLPILMGEGEAVENIVGTSKGALVSGAIVDVGATVVCPMGAAVSRTMGGSVEFAVGTTSSSTAEGDRVFVTFVVVGAGAPAGTGAWLVITPGGGDLSLTVVGRGLPVEVGAMVGLL